MADYFISKMMVKYIYIVYFKKDTLLFKKNASVIFIEFTKMNCKGTDENDLCVSILLNKMGWYLGIIVNLHNY